MKPFILSSLILASSCLLSATAIASDSIECKILETKTKVMPADYVPGVDAEGNKVVPADVEEKKKVAVNDVIKFPLTLDLANKLQQLKDLGITAESVLGVVEIHNDGRVKYNDQDITTSMKTLCGHALKEEVVEVTEEKPKEETKAETVEVEKPATVEEAKVETEEVVEEQVEQVTEKAEEVTEKIEEVTEKVEEAASQNMEQPKQVEELDRVVQENTAMPPPPPAPNQNEIKHETEVIQGGAYREYYE